MSYFALLNHPNGGVVPLMDEEGESVATFGDPGSALEAIKTCALGAAYGGKVFDTDEPFTET